VCGLNTVNETNKIYIILSQTGTVPSRLIRLFTGAEYNHASISVSKDLTRMYSFGRRNPYNPFWAGFVRENPAKGTFKRFPNTKAAVLEVDVSEESFIRISNRLEEMYQEQNKYHYNYIGLVLARAHIARKKKNCYFCSEFVGELLEDNNINGTDKLPDVVYPMNFFDLPHKQIYQGRLLDYNNEK
jgi:hypothetical protein